VVEAFRVHPATGIFLQAVVANGLGGADSLFDIAFFEDAALFLDMVPASPSQVISLEFQANTGIFAFFFAVLFEKGVVAEDILRVVTDLMSDDIGF